MLSWNPNTEPDLAGYRVYKAEQLSPTNFSFVAETTSACYALDTADEDDFFAVTAFDQTGNESGLSQSVQFVIPEPPDTTPPAVPGVPWISDTMCLALEGKTIHSSAMLKSDIDCDGDTDGTDAFMFRREYGDYHWPGDVVWSSECIVRSNTDGSCICETT
jgi:hypothetical protein